MEQVGGTATASPWPRSLGERNDRPVQRVSDCAVDSDDRHHDAEREQENSVIALSSECLSALDVHGLAV
jgi:hypothetical protein